MSQTFLYDLFKITNDHIRATERKYLIITGAFIGLFSALLSSVPPDFISSIQEVPQLTKSISIHIFLLIIGSFVYLMQNWYRAWKEHYLDVCISIRRHLAADLSDSLMPYWLRQEIPENRIAVDNLLKILTIIVNLLLVAFISFEIIELVSNLRVAIIAVIILVLGYLIFLYTVDRTMRKSNILYA